MNQAEFQREVLAFDEKIALAELEVAKAEERVKELKYQKSHFQFEMVRASISEQERIAQQSVPQA